MDKRRKKTNMYSENGSKRAEYYAIIKLLESGMNQYAIHRKLEINRYSVRKVAEAWKKEQEEQEEK